MEPIIVKLPYPSVDGITPDKQAAAIISPAYAGLYSELTAILQYTYQDINFDYQKMDEYAMLLEQISLAEMIHFELLGKMLIRLGVVPVMSQVPPYKQNFFNTSTVSYATNPQKMLIDSIAGEMEAIRGYQDMLKKLTNEQVAAVIKRILLDEMLHLEELREALENLTNRSVSQTTEAVREKI